MQRIALSFMHSGVLWDQDRCADLCRHAADLEGGRYAEVHLPLPPVSPPQCRTRAMTMPQEQASLDDGGFSG